MWGGGLVGVAHGVLAMLGEARRDAVRYLMDNMDGMDDMDRMPLRLCGKPVVF